MSQDFDSSDFYNHYQYYVPDSRASSDWSGSSSAGTPMTRNPSIESANTTYSDDLTRTPSSEYGSYNWSYIPISNQDSLWSPMSDSSHDNTFPLPSYNTPYMPNMGEDWWVHYDFVADVEPGQQPYGRLNPRFESTDLLPATRIAEESARSQTSEGMFFCMEKDCPKSFRRKADLERHCSHIHTSAENKAKYPCDWKKCQRAKEPFNRRDHMRDHYRAYHHEDLLRRGSSSREDQKWWSERKIKLDWWRCARCLGRVKVKEDGYSCPICRTNCEPERQYYRTR
ncbi:hypothetical protein F5Y03DRAFT_394736 [Xylaria venustula]|nr:hypothetical protein F5Y03DRAFT_394736 [Xylaria venustula]